MSIARSLYTGWTGLATHQRSLDNIGNNLANANSTGFKKNEFLFASLFNQVLSGSMPAGSTTSSTIGVNMGAGVTTGAIKPTHAAGPMEQTGRNLDVAINGGGFFLVNAYGGQALTRNGSFYLDYTESPNSRLLCSGDGYPVQGWNSVDGLITPSTTTGNIYLPAEGDVLPGAVTTRASISGILPTTTTGAEFTGNATQNLDLKGNLSAGGGNVVDAVIYAPVTQIQDDSPVVSGEIQEIPVRIVFSGPVQSADGAQSVYDMTMTTRDWPRAGDPPVQIYPETGTSLSTGFYNQADAAQTHGAGQIVEPVEIAPGSATVNSVIDLGGGSSLETSFSLTSDFNIDISRLTSLDAAPGGNQLESWSVDGNPTGSMARTVKLYDETTRFAGVPNADGTTAMQAARRVEARQITLQFAKTGSTGTGSSWSWKSAAEAAGGALEFNTVGDLAASTPSGGSVDYDFSGLRSINYAASLTVPLQDGYVDGYLKDLSIDQYGRIFGHYSNDVAEPLAQLAMATVPNPTGVYGMGGTLFYASPSSGDIMIGVAGDENGAVAADLAPIGAGGLTSHQLEGSNVNLGVEFTSLISTERGYQANARVITTTDEMIQTLVQMKR